MNTIYMPVIDPLAIPYSMSTYAGVMKIIAAGAFGLFLVIALITEQAKALKGDQPPKIREILVRAGLIFAGLVLYRHIFAKIVAFNEVIAMSLLSLEDFAKFKVLLTSHLDKLPTSVLKMTFNSFLVTGFIYASMIGEVVLQYFRYILLALLYILGPLAFVTALLPETARLTKGWFITLLQVSFWIVILRVTQAVMLMMNIEQTLSNGDVMGYLFVTVLMTALVFFTPLISERLLSGSNISLMGGIAMAAGTAMLTKIATHPATKGTTAGIGRGVAAAYKGMSEHPWGEAFSRFTRAAKPAADKSNNKPAPRR